MIKHIVHLIFFAAGAGVGVWWGVNHPDEAANIASQEQAKIQQAMALGKKQALQQVVNDPTSDPAHADRYKQMLNAADQELNSVSASQKTP